MNIQGLINVVSDSDNYRLIFSTVIIVLLISAKVYLSSKNRKLKIDKWEHRRDIINIAVILFVIIANLSVILFYSEDIDQIMGKFTLIAMMFWFLFDGIYSVYFKNEIKNEFDYKLGRMSINFSVMILIALLAFQFREQILKFVGLE